MAVPNTLTNNTIADADEVMVNFNHMTDMIDDVTNVTTIKDANGNEVIKAPATVSAVNEITVTNAATGGTPTILATGDDTNIHLALTPKGNGLVKISVLRQNITTNVYTPSSVMLTGWSFCTGDGATNPVDKTITFGITFGSAPTVHVSPLGGKITSDPTAIGDFDLQRQPLAIAYNITTTNFVAAVNNAPGTPIASGTRLGFTWIAIGTL